MPASIELGNALLIVDSGTPSPVRMSHGCEAEPSAQIEITKENVHGISLWEEELEPDPFNDSIRAQTCSSNALLTSLPHSLVIWL